jgi:ubiquinone/menaquinone biosynthesis C-methylase UbiE
MLPLAAVGTHALIHPYIRGAGLGISAGLASRRRKDLVTAQYGTMLAARGYVRGHEGARRDGRHLQTRVELILDLLADAPAGQLLDAGCGPGVLARILLRSPRHGFGITVLDQSPAMVSYCVENVGEDTKLGASVGDLEALPFRDASFDVTLATGALEYLSPRAAVREIARVTRPGGMVVTSMLNPLNPYRLSQWFLYWPALRALGTVERALGLRRERRHGAAVTGIRALRPARLRAYMRRAGLVDVRVIFFDPTVLIPPLDRCPTLVRVGERVTRAVTCRWLMPWLATGYLVTARRS